MAFEKPQSRNEAILQNMLGAENELVPPQSRIEALLQAILLQGVPDGAVTTDKLADGAVTYDKLAEALRNLIDGKENKKTWTTLLTATTTEDAVFQLDDTSAGEDLNSYSEIIAIFELPTATTTYPKYSWYYNGAYGTGVNCTVASTNFRWWVLSAKKVNGLWWIESRVSDTTDRLGYLHKSIYRENVTNLTMASFEGIRFYLTSTSNLPSGTKIRVWGLK